MMKCIFVMHINIEVFYKLIISFWVYTASHAQSTQNKLHIFAIYPEKHGGWSQLYVIIMSHTHLEWTYSL